MRQKLNSLLVDVVEKRFLYYMFRLSPMHLEPQQWGVEVRRANGRVPAAGSIAELADVLEKYFFSAGFRVMEPVRVDRDGLALVVGCR